jgi:hypothetical protein
MHGSTNTRLLKSQLTRQRLARSLRFMRVLSVRTVPLHWLKAADLLRVMP